MSTLVQIKRLVLSGRIEFTEKARDELDADHLTADDVVESIANARSISKTLRSTRRIAGQSKEKLYVIKSRNYSGTLIYTKGTIRRRAGYEVFYVFISAKIAAERGER